MLRNTTVCLFLLNSLLNTPVSGDDFQYEFQDIRIPKASAGEPLRAEVSTQAAVTYLEHGATAWSGSRNCVSCHTNGTYMTIRPALTPTLGKPDAAHRDFFISQLRSLQEQPESRLKQATRPAQVIYIAAGLAEWDRHVSGSLSPETREALELMFSIQLETGTWGSLDCWPPFESSAYHEATVAAMAVAAAPGWLDSLSDDDKSQSLKNKIALLQHYLRTEQPPHDYGRVVLLWAAARMPDLLTSEETEKLKATLLSKQHADGSWAMRDFAAPEQWGGGNRAEKLRAEEEFSQPPGDGHMTGLAVIVLREHGLDAKAAPLQQATTWLLQNQQESGRWWTRSLNTDSWHFITYSGTAYPVLALQMTHVLQTE